MLNFIVINGFKEILLFQITKYDVQSEKIDGIGSKISPVLRFKVTPIEFYYFHKEITNWKNFIDILYNKDILRNNLIYIKFIKNYITTIDYKWNCITYITLMEKIETEHMFSWLSTLGGGYSALGDHFNKCAKIAAKISLQQLALCLKLGDPNMQARCKLFYSISLIQQGKLRLAKNIIRQQYKFAQSLIVEDSRLIKMCEGIWLKLQHSYRSRNLSKTT